MANSVMQDREGVDWPLGNIVVPIPGTPVAITSLVDPSLFNAPQTATLPQSNEYSCNAQQLIFSGYNGGGAGTPKLQPNTGNVYIVRRPTAGNGGIADTGIIVKVLAPGETFFLGSAASVRNVFNLYRYFIDADTANDACQVTAIIQ